MRTDSKHPRRAAAADHAPAPVLAGQARLERARAVWAFVTRTRYRRPLYTHPLMSAEERALQRESIRNFIGGRSPNPVVARYYRERSRLALLASDNVSESRKQELRAAGPLCSPEDEAEVLANRAKKARPREF